MNSNRRTFFSRVASAGAGLLAGTAWRAQGQNTTGAGMQNMSGIKGPVPAAPLPERADAAPSVVTPDIPHLPWKLVDGVKEFHLTAEVVRSEFLMDRPVTAWGYNGSVPGPTIEINEGDRVRVVFENRLPEPTSIHWHGLEVPVAMDGVPGISQPPVPPGGRFVYEFTLNQNGTYFYHSHMAMQEMMGMLGFFIIHPKTATTPRVDRDFGILLQEWAILPNNDVPNTMAMEFNWLTFNGKAGPASTPLIVKQGERVRIRFVNLGMDHHPMHLHGNHFAVTGTEAGRIPEHLWFRQNTVLVAVAQARDIEFEAQYPGDWMLHCHLPHHMMNQMASMVGPLTPARGMQTGRGMEEGMGMLRQGGALADDFGPSLGRAVGISADSERAAGNAIGAAAAASAAHDSIDAMPDMQHHNPAAAGAPSDSASDTHPTEERGKKLVPGYPQDMWMPMDRMAGDKPELYGLPPGWTGAIMGMTTLVRVVSPEVFAKIEALRERQNSAAAMGLKGSNGGENRGV